MTKNNLRRLLDAHGIEHLRSMRDGAGYQFYFRDALSEIHFDDENELITMDIIIDGNALRQYFEYSEVSLLVFNNNDGDSPIQNPTVDLAVVGSVKVG